MKDRFAERLTGETPHLRRFARSLETDPDAADDLVQACLERAWRKRRLWNPRGSLRSWLFRILHREFLNARRGKGRTAETPPLDEDDMRLATGADQHDHMNCADALDAVAALPPDQRAAVSLVAFEDVSYMEAARILEIPEGTLRSRLARGRRALRDSLVAEEAPRQPQLRRVK
ncbi:RNA polymerase subunit sigma [Marinicauda salina]|uniref:RNA polymerase subunit sigma n=2 Tax=Marinicauda salina TaxID=2135793 RepID=A0A2U2BUS3_9PROT|nr:RNA polymerase subunit sigma [Marinicauda salina]